MRLRALLRMPPREIADPERGRSLEVARSAEEPGVSPARSAERAVPAERLRARFQARCRTRFFAGAGTTTPPALSRTLTRARRDGARRRGAACHGRFDLLGYRGLSFGDPDRLALDPVPAGARPLVHWSAARPLDAEPWGTRKVVWELNRHQWMVRSLRRTGSPATSATPRAFVGRVTRLDAPPIRAGLGINWTSSLEVALRLDRLVLGARALPRGSPHAHARAFSSESRRGRAHTPSHVETYLSVLLLAQHAPHGRGARPVLRGRPLSRAAARAAAGARSASASSSSESGRQVLADGVYFEQSTVLPALHDRDLSPLPRARRARTA